MPKWSRPAMSRTAVLKRNKKKLKSFLLSSQKSGSLPRNFFESIPSTSRSNIPNNIADEQEHGTVDDTTELNSRNDTYFEENDVYSSQNGSGGHRDNIHSIGVPDEMICVTDDDYDDEIDDCSNDEQEYEAIKYCNDADEINSMEDERDNDYDDINCNSVDNVQNQDSDEHVSDSNDDDDGDDDEEDDNPFFSSKNMDRIKFLLKPNKNITMKDHFLSIVALAVKYRMSYESMLGFFRWMKVSHPTSRLPTTKAGLWKILSRNKSMISRYHYCKLCGDYLGTKNNKNELKLRCACKTCGPKKAEKHLGSFVSISLISQIKQMLKLPNIAQSLQYRFVRQKKKNEAVEDIYDGLEYQRLCSPGNFLENWFNFSITLNTDGCQITNTTNVSVWPVYAEINELPPHMRKKYMLLAAVYVGDEHPKMNVLLRPFTLQMRKLFQTGITWKPSKTTEVTSKFIVVAASLDAPARAAVVKMKQYNGYFGCLYCYAKGKRIQRRLVYPFNQSYKKLRTEIELKADIKYVIGTGKIRHGIKGCSSLKALPLFNITKGVVVETMHSVFLGVSKLHTTILETTKKAPYYIGNSDTSKAIDKILLSIRTPSCRSRKPRSITSYVQWKASEWRNWLEYAPVCLQSVLDKKYVNHLALLSEAIHYLNSDSITLSELSRASFLLKEYAKKFEEIFGQVKMTSNIHALSHLIECIRNWGPMWAHNAFIFEAWNKKVIDFLTSPIGREDQITTRFLMQRFINYTVFDDSISSITKDFIVKELKVVDGTRTTKNRNKFVLEEQPNNRPISRAEYEVLRKAGYTPERLSTYDTMHVNGVRFSSQDEDKITKSSDSFIYKDVDDTFCTIRAIVKFHNESEVITGIIVKGFQHIGYGFNTRHIHIIKAKNTLSFVESTFMIRPAIKMITENNTFAVKLGNCWETD